MCLCEKCEFLAIYFFNYLVMILEEKSQHMGPFIECIFALKNVRSQQWIEKGGWGGGVSGVKILRDHFGRL